MNYLMLLPVFTAFVVSIVIFNLHTTNDEEISAKSEVLTIIISALSYGVIYFFYGQEVTLIKFNDVLSISFKVDGLGSIFIALVAFLWPLASLYASKYMTHEGGFKKFFCYYTATFGVIIGLSLSANMLTMYMFYEMLTFITLPLVVHNGKDKDLYAGRVYITYSVTGASLSFMGMMVYMSYIGSWDFGFDLLTVGSNTNLLIAYVLMFIGFSFKAGVFPFHRWLIAAGVAPTPVTALLHAVAVVKSGAFATMRLTYYLFEPEYLKGTFAQYFVMIAAITTIIFGSSMAMKNKHLKRRFAYSTMSQLSYILLGVASMSKLGLVAAILHLVYHAFIKIVIFYTAGNVLFQTHSEYVGKIEGYGLKMKTTFICFTISSLALIGIPPLGGFSSKIALATSVIEVGDTIGFIAVCALMISALLTAMYLLQIAVRAFVPHNDFDYSSLDKVKEAPWQMSGVVLVLTMSMIVLSLLSNQLYTGIYTLIWGGM